MPTEAITIPDASFLACAYQFERGRMGRILTTADGDYVLPAVWRGHGGWRKLGAFAAARRLDAVRYVRWCLDVVQVGLPPNVPEPNRQLERQRMDDYVADCRKVKTRILIQYRGELERTRRYFTISHKGFGDEQEIALLRVLIERDHHQLSLLFCCQMARRVGTPECLRLAERWEPDALFQYSRDPEENAAVYGDLWRFPTDFAAKADRLYARVTGAEGAVDE